MNTSGHDPPRGRRRAMIALGGMLIGAMVAVAPPASAKGGGYGLEWGYDERSDGWTRTPDGTAPESGEPPQPDEDGYYWMTQVGGEKNEDDLFTWWCDPNVNDGGDTRDGVCDDEEGNWSSVTCAGLWPPDDRPAMPHARLRQHEDWTEDGEFELDGEWDYVSWECVPLTDDNWVSQEDVWEINYDVFQGLGESEINVAPGDNALVNLPTIVSTDYPTAADLAEGDAEFIEGAEPGEEPVTIRIPIEIERPGENFEGEITATAEFEWEFEEGETQTGRGTPYEPGRLPEDDPGYYVTNVFTTTGTKTVTLNITWTGEVDVPPLEPEPVLPVEIEPAATEEVPVQELSSVLTR